MAFDPGDKKFEAVVKRLRDDEVGWLVTVHKNTPRPVPVWFLWDGGRKLLVYSSPSSLKTRTIAEHPEVAFHFNSTEQGGEVAILYGRVEQANHVPSMLDNGAYMAKYRGPLDAHAAATNTTDQAINDEFAVPLVMTIDDARSW